MRFLTHVSTLVLTMLLPAPLWAGKLALILSNADYEYVQDLRTTHGDADAYAEVMAEFGYTVTQLKDLNRNDMLDALDVFTAGIQTGDDVVFVFSGHGWSDGSTNYLVPTDAPFSATDSALRRDTVALQNGWDGVLDGFQRAQAKLTVAIIDACRNNPFEAPAGRRSTAMRSGLARMDGREGTFVIFSAGAGQEALDSLSTDSAEDRLSVFTRSFLPYLRKGLYLETAIGKAQSDTRSLALTQNGHRQVPAYYDEAPDLNCIAPSCTASVPVVQPDIAALEAERQRLQDELAALSREAEVQRRAREEAEAEAEEARRLAARQAPQTPDPEPEQLAALQPSPETLARRRLSAALLLDEETQVLALQRLLSEFPGTDAARAARAQLDRLKLPTPPAGTTLSLAEQMILNDDVQACDRLAGSPFHPDRTDGLMRETGTQYDQIDPVPAIAACQRALGAFPDHPRLLAFLGEALHAAGRFEEALPAFRAAAQAGDPLGQAGLGVLYYDGHAVQQSFDEAFRLFSLSAEQGFVDGKTNLGWMYQRGEGVARSDTSAVGWFRKAAELGDPAGQYALGWMYREGYGVPQSYATASDWFRRSAEQGNPDAQDHLGYLYEEGLGIAQSDASALFWYRKAAEQGITDAQNSLGRIYEDGRGVDASNSIAVSWYRQAAEGGLAQGQYNLGWMYLNGRGIAQSDTEAAAWYRRSAEQGYASAQSALGRLYENGDGVEQSDEIAVSWYRKAADQDLARAQYNLGWMYRHGRGVDKSDKLAAEWFRKAAEQGHASSQNWLGFLYRNGQGVPQSDASAVFWYRKAAEQDMSTAQYNLGWMYRNGRGVPQSDEEAVVWYRKSSDQGFDRAQNALGYMHRHGLAVPQDLAEAVRLYRLAADQGLPAAQNNLGWMYREGLGIAKNDTTAVAWFREAADQNHAAALNNLGYMIRHGRGVAQSDEEAADFYRRSAEAGNATGKLNWAVTLELGRGVPKDPELSARYFVEAMQEGVDDPLEWTSGQWRRDTARALQRRLRDMGLYDGAIDGVIGQGTKTAMRKLLPEN